MIYLVSHESVIRDSGFSSKNILKISIFIRKYNNIQQCPQYFKWAMKNLKTGSQAKKFENLS
jgi:hypothetical protein